jgi:acetylornithine deacetylase/succinyl-diaminopimelate desuccinylase-like protein
MTPYQQQHQPRFLEELKELLRIPSVSADSAYAADVSRAAAYIKERLQAAGADNVELCPTAGFPIVYGEKMIDPKLPTVLVYGHYDVQPADPIALWDTPPFEPTIRDGKIYARGACDDKGQMYMHIKALEIMLQTNTLPCNVKFMIEGEEEVGSDNLEPFVLANRERLQADVILISDTGMLSNENPSITVGLRGLAYMLVEVVGPNRDLHSGTFGGAVANPVNALCQMIASLHDAQGRVTIPGFYDKVAELSAGDRAAMAAAPFSEHDMMHELGISAVRGEAGYTTLERRSIRPTLDVNGMWGGYIGEGAKTVLPSKANAKISMRLVPNQISSEISDLFAAHFMSLAPEGVTVTVTSHHGGEAAVTPTDSVAFKAASLAFEEAWGKTPIPMRDGGSIPIVALFEKELGLKTVLLGFGLDTDAIHSPNEHYGLFNFEKGIETIPLFFKHYAALMASQA